MKYQFISHYAHESWGSEIYIMEINGKAFGRAYWYYDDSSTIYLAGLSVNKEERKMGIGTELQNIREEIGRKMGATISCLWVQKNTWMHEWYKRRGYKDWGKNEHEKNTIWMEKSLI